MARCNRCNRFLWFTPSTGYCDSCYEIVLKEREQQRKRLEESRKKEEENRKKHDTWKYLIEITNHYYGILAQGGGKSVRITVDEDLYTASFMNYPIMTRDGERFNVCSIFQIDKPNGRRITFFLCIDVSEEQLQNMIIGEPSTYSNMLFVVSQLDGRIFDKDKERAFITAINVLGREYRRTYNQIPAHVLFLDDSYY